jgi:putative hemolysin
MRLSMRIRMITICVICLFLISGYSNNCYSEVSSAVINPATAYCTALGYSSKDGSCIFLDQSMCPEWNFYRGTCGQRFSHCAKNGFTIQARTDNMGTWTSEYAVCIFTDTSECLEQDYFHGKCSPAQCKKWLMSRGGCVPQ